MTQEEFIARCKELHPEYDYTNTVFTTMYDYVSISCPIHGEFKMRAYRFLENRRCQKCVGKYIYSYDELVEEARRKHNNLYDYIDNSANYAKKSISNFIAVCPKHGEFEVNIKRHLLGTGCLRCKFKTYDEVIEACKVKHNNYYTYVDTKHEFKSTGSKLTAICPVHGEFKISAYYHMHGRRCPQCTKESHVNHNEKTYEEHLEICRCKYNYKYKYFEKPTNYRTTHTMIDIECPEHGIFRLSLHSHKIGAECARCAGGLLYSGVSKAETAVFDWLRPHVPDLIQSARKLLARPRKELDMYSAKHRIAVEFNGLHWHKECDKHQLQKLELCEQAGIRLITIYDDEWSNKQDIVKSKILSAYNIHANVIYARKCVVKTISSKEYKQFTEQNHLQGYVAAKYKYGLFYNGKLVAAMSFGSYRVALGRRHVDNEYELLRFCSLLNTQIVGGASKLFKHFCKDVKPAKIISYANRRFSAGNLYEKLGFEFVRYTTPNYYYYKPEDYVRLNRFKFTKAKLVKLGYDPLKTEFEIMQELGYHRIYDCGSILYQIKF